MPFTWASGASQYTEAFPTSYLSNVRTWVLSRTASRREAGYA